MSEEKENVEKNGKGKSEPAKTSNSHPLIQNENFYNSIAEIVEGLNNTRNLANVTANMNPARNLANVTANMNPARDLANITANMNHFKHLTDVTANMNPARDLANITANMNHFKHLTESVGSLNINKRLSAMAESPLKKINSNWLLSDSVVKSISLNNNEIEAREIFNKIPKEKFEIGQEYDEKNDALEYVLKNNEDKYSVPFSDVVSTLAVSDFLTSISTTEIFDFYNYLVKFPMLGITHAIGEKIFKEISKVKLTEYKDLVLFRVRDRDVLKNDIPYSDLEMFEAPFGMANHGRFNVIGQGELYTCSDDDVALKEIVRDEEHLRYDFIKWELQEPVRLLELSSLDNAIGKYISIDKANNTNAYLVPNFLSQCAKIHGITGISYVSVIDKSATNYVFFDFEKKWFKTIDRLTDVKSNGEAT